MKYLLRSHKKHKFSIARVYKNKAFVLYILTIFTIYFADTIFSYSAPYIITYHTKNVALMGMIIGFSSVVGLIADFVISENLKNKSFVYFLRVVFIFASSCSLVFLFLPPVPLTFFISMGLWGVYYDSIRFANFNAVYTLAKPKNYVSAWGAIEEARVIAVTLAPIVAFTLLQTNSRMSFQIILFILLVSSLLTGFLNMQSKTQVKPSKLPRLGLKHEFKVVFELIKKIWPIYLFLVSMFILDSAFWTIGVLLGIELSETSALGKYILPAYTWPGIVVSLFAGRIASRFDKTKASLMFGVFGSLLLFLGFGLLHKHLLFFVVLGSATMFAFVWPEVFATLEEYADKLSEYRSELIGLGDSTSNLGYIIGPILAGFLASKLGNVQAIMLISIFPLSVGLAALTLHIKNYKILADTNE